MKVKKFFISLAYWLARYLLKVLACLFFRVKVRGLENVPQEEGLVVTANHASFLDPPILGLVLNRRLLFLAKPNVIAKFFVSLSWAYPIDKIGSLLAATRFLRKGGAVAVFPEGERRTETSKQSFKDGFYNLARMAQALVLPVSIKGTEKIWPRNKKLPRLGGKIVVDIGEPFSVHKMSSEAAILELGEKLGKLIQK